MLSLDEMQMNCLGASPFNVFVCADMESEFAVVWSGLKKRKFVPKRTGTKKFAALTKTVLRFVKLLHIKAGSTYLLSPDSQRHRLEFEGINISRCSVCRELVQGGQNHDTAF